MKQRKAQILFLLILTIISFSCNNQPKEDEILFEYVIHGFVTNGDSTIISLYIPSLGLDDRKTTQIIDGKYQFKGFAKNNESAYIKFENDIINPGNISCIAHLFIESDTVILNFGIDTLDFGLCFKDKEFLKGKNNLYYSETQKKFSTEPIWTFSDPDKMDSMQKHVYPRIKKEILVNYQHFFHNNEYDIVSLYYLDYIVNNLRQVFEPEYLTVEDKEKLRLFLDDINDTLKNTETYIFVKNSITNLIENKQIDFRDFSLIDFNGDSVRLSEIIPKNELTVIYFWWSMCSPCREFIKTVQPKYDSIKKNSLEIISINTDQSQSLWREISRKDNINWINLYSGDRAEIVAFYNVTYFPRILIFDKEFNLLSEEYKDLERLIYK